MALEPEKALHPSGCSGNQNGGEKRKKVDMKDGETKGEPKLDLRKSLAWDSAFFTSPGFLEAEELFHSNEKASAGTKTDAFNSRSSLAWDNAFLTCEGVLNPVELCLVNKGFSKSEKHLLSAIRQLRISSHSHADHTHASSSLASLELQLFEHHHHTPLQRMEGPTHDQPKLPNPRKHHSQKPSTIPSSKQCCDGSEFKPSSSLKPPKSSGRLNSSEMAPTKRVSLIANEVKQERKSSIAPSKPRWPIKCSESENGRQNSPFMKKKHNCISHLAPKSTACRDCRVGPKETSSNPRSNKLSSANSKASGIRLPSPKIGYFDEGEAGMEESENRSKALKDKDMVKSSKGSCQHCEDNTKDCIRSHKMRTRTAAKAEAQTQLCVKGKRPISHKHHRQAITTIGDSGDVLIELSTNQGP